MSLITSRIDGIYVFSVERRYTPGGKELAQLKGSVSKKKGDAYENLSVDVTVWEPKEDNLIWQLKKGDRIKVEGSLWARAYISKKDGEAKVALNVTGDKMEMDNYSGGTTSGSDDIPF